MAASLGQGCEPSWLRSVDEVDSQRLLELMMGPIEWRRSSSSKHTTNTLDLLGAVQPPDYESAIELDSDSPPPSGWEKCLDLKTGSIYFLNRSTGVSSSSDPRKASLQASVNINWSPSPTTSEVTVEATSKVKATSDQLHLNVNDLKKMKKKKKGALVDAKRLDLSLRLHMGSSPKAMIKEDLPFQGRPHSTNSLSHNSLSKGLATTRASSSSSTTSSPTQTTSINQDIINEGLRRPAKSQDLHPKDRESKISREDNHLISRSHNLVSIKNSGLLDEERFRKPEGGEAAMNSMVTVGCANCLMFVMLSRSNLKCPRCGTCPLLDSPQPNAKKSKLGFSV